MPAESPAVELAAPSLRRRAVSGSIWWAASYAGSKGLQIASGIALAWLLTPAAFGIVALADIIIRGLNTVSDVGIRPALIQNPRDDGNFHDTAWTIQLIRGAIIWVVAIALAWPIAHFYQTPQLMWILPVAGFGALVLAMQSTQFIRLNRTLDEGPRAILRLTQSIVARGSMIAIAIVSPTPWALVIGGLAGTIYFVARTHRMATRHGHAPRHRLRMEPEAARTLYHFGRWVLVGSLIIFAAREVDKLLLGKIVHQEMATLGLLGIYVIAQRLANLPSEAVHVLAGQIALPVLAEVARNHPEQFEQKLLKFRRIILLPGMTTSLAVIWFSPVFFLWLYDDRYAAAAWMAPLISLTIWVTLLNGLVNRALLALAQVRTLAWTGAVNAAGTIVGGLVGYKLADVPGFIVGLALGNLLQHTCEVVILHRQGFRVWKQDVAYCLIFVLLAGIGAAPRWLAMPGLSETTQQALALATPAVMLAGMAWFTFRRVWPEVRRK